MGDERDVLGKVSRKITDEQLSTGRCRRELKAEKCQLCGELYMFGCIHSGIDCKDMKLRRSLW